MRNVLNRQGNPLPITPELYHAHHLRHSEDIPFWLALARRQAGALLELGCGTGRVLLALNGAGIDVYGLDNDWRALAFLNSQASTDRSSPIKIFQADFSRFQLAHKFDLIILPCNTLSTISESHRLALFNCVFSHLSPNGIFAASLPSPHLLRSMPAIGAEDVEDVFPHPLDGGLVQVRSTWERSDQSFDITWRYEHQRSDGEIIHMQTQISHSLDMPEIYTEQLEQAGYQYINTQGDFNGSPYRSRSNYLILIASSQPIPKNLLAGIRRKWKN